MNRTIITLLICIGATNLAFGAAFQTERLKRIASYLPKEVVERQDSVLNITSYPCDLIKRTQAGVVTHLGFRLFEAPVGGNMQQLADFLERITLELYQQGSNKQTDMKLTELKMTWKENGRKSNAPYTSLCNFLGSSAKKDNISIDFANKMFSAKWQLNNKTYELLFPAIRELIQGIDLSEAEQVFMSNLKKSDFKGTAQPKRLPLSMLKQIKGGMYRSFGAVYSGQSSYTNDTYYYKTDDKYATAIYSNAYPSESMVNMMAGAVPCGNRTLQLSFHLYGGKIEKMTVPFAIVYSSLFRDMRCYTKYDVSDKNMHYARFLYENEEMQYVHVIEIEIPPHSEFDDNATLKAHIYCYIPQHNLKKIIDRK